MKTTLSALATRYDAFLIDQFGVLLHGDGIYPGTPSALASLAGMGKAIVLLSNSGKRAAPNEARLTRLGFARTSYRCVMSSGEAAFGQIAARIGHDIAPGAAVWLHARDGDLSPITGLDLRLVADAAAADLLIIAGSRGDEITLDDYRAWLAPAVLRRVPALCTNPDMTMLTPVGQRFGAGAIARMYQSMGGAVEWVGKPFGLIYCAAHAALGSPDPSRVLCIGDSPAHDIAGGRDAGFATALVRTGLHADLTDTALMDHWRATAMPDHIIPSFHMQAPR